CAKTAANSTRNGWVMIGSVFTHNRLRKVFQIARNVLRDCVRSGKKHIVHAKMCVIYDERIIEIGNNITQEFETYICERVGQFDAKLTVDRTRIHKDYFNLKEDTCKNGKKIGEEWTEDEHIRRACHNHKGHAVIVDRGCVIPDGRMIAVGSRATWKEPAKDGRKEFVRSLFCEKGETGWGAEFTIEHVVDGKRPARLCENGKHEEHQWTDRNVLRTCKEVNDQMSVVAIRCVYSNETLEIATEKTTEDVKETPITRIPAARTSKGESENTGKPSQCEGGRRENEEW
ncbi:hypothetical protein PENTCL1PPCAC_3183, partial [Pristionchus entomophagus]